jgi:hypothetical protein
MADLIENNDGAKEDATPDFEKVLQHYVDIEAKHYKRCIEILQDTMLQLEELHAENCNKILDPIAHLNPHLKSKFLFKLFNHRGDTNLFETLKAMNVNMPTTRSAEERMKCLDGLRKDHPVTSADGINPDAMLALYVSSSDCEPCKIFEDKYMETLLEYCEKRPIELKRVQLVNMSEIRSDKIYTLDGDPVPKGIVPALNYVPCIVFCDKVEWKLALDEDRKFDLMKIEYDHDYLIPNMCQADLRNTPKFALDPIAYLDQHLI